MGAARMAGRVNLSTVAGRKGWRAGLVAGAAAFCLSMAIARGDTGDGAALLAQPWDAILA